MTFPQDDKISEQLILDDKIFIITEPLDVSNERNVYCFSQDKQFLWRIQDPQEAYPEVTGKFCFVNFTTLDGLAATNIVGVRFHLDKETGKITGRDCKGK